ncbi:uncharacterized protein STEHIDRAFT_163041 [Stereum hirsutum FP-91666 SS1]|uniref:Uncharacterized protein n=1 Tax=Stereum hirsutum (strain FP-91666) TaxID=721885 RepID=R7S0T8_STEHR|nr:uncharacterized protein STEHIDRAFT_163041 [Stereum hirsutum FP-91666 SS1]EIM80167.1 hypothetical protein STEHIDRAFT_163041 [Stereum hirsutum FP-91666 SS1]
MQSGSTSLVVPYSDHDQFPVKAMRTSVPFLPVSLVEHPLGLLVDYLDWKTIQRLSMTSKGVRRVVHHALRTRLHHILRHWIEPADLFMRLLEETGAVLIGDIVLAFIYRTITPWFTSPLHISCPNNDVAVTRLKNFFRTPGHYNIRQNRAPVEGLSEIRDIIHATRTRSRGPFESRLTQYIEIIVSSTSNATSPIPRLWNSAFVSYLSSTEMVVAYPKSAFQRCSFIPPSLGEVASFDAKYALAKHGVHIRTYRNHTSSSDEITMLPGYGWEDRRSFDDKYSFRMRVSLGRDSPIAGALDPPPVHRKEHAFVTLALGSS